MAINQQKYLPMIAGFFTLLSFSCTKKHTVCPKEGYEYINTTSLCWYSPASDSIAIGSIITLEASVPKTFIDDVTNTTINNTTSYIECPFGVGMLYPLFAASIDSFELTAQIGKIIKDTVHLSSGQLKGVRTIRWDGNAPDSFRMKITIKALARGIYSFSLGQQGYRDSDCALYKYFLKVGNADQHLNYWMQYLGNVSDGVRYFTYCIKIY